MHRQLLSEQDLTGLPETIEEVLEGAGHATCMAFNPYGTLLATGCQDGEVVIWDYLTRGPARTFKPAHNGPVTALIWSRSSRRLTSASLDGTAIIWDTVSGEKLLEQDLGRGGITHMSTSDAEAAAESFTGEDTILFSFEKGPAEVRTLAEPEKKEIVPMLWLEGDGKTSRLAIAETCSSGKEDGQNALAVFSPDGRVVAVATYGLLTLLRYPSMEILDIVRVGGNPRVHSIHFESHGRQILLTAADKQLRVYDISSGKNKGGPELNSVPAKTIADVKAAVSSKIPKQDSLLYSEKDPGAVLIQSRKFEATMERASWRAAAFSPNGEHVASAIDNKNEHVIYNWNVHYGFSENTLQGGGKEGIISLTWHPEKLPMQLLALSSSGKIYIWAKIFTQEWRAFAPDFEDLKENKEHVELETEFDINPKEGQEAGNQGGLSDGEVNTEELDIVTPLEDPVHNARVARLKQGEQPLYYLPVIIPQAQEEVEEPLGEAKKDGMEVEEAAAAAVAAVEEREAKESSPAGTAVATPFAAAAVQGASEPDNQQIEEDKEVGEDQEMDHDAAEQQPQQQQMENPVGGAVEDEKEEKNGAVAAMDVDVDDNNDNATQPASKKSLQETTGGVDNVSVE